MPPRAVWSLATLVAAAPAQAGPECKRDCEPVVQDVFGCCPATPTSTGRVGSPPDRGVPVVAFEGPAGQALLGMKVEVTQALYQAVTGHAPSANGACGASCPVERVSWCDATAFANRLSARDWLRPAYRFPDGFRPGLDPAACDLAAGAVILDPGANGWRLPTETEWEALASLDEPSVPEPPGGPARRVDGRPRPVCDGREERQGACDAVGNVWEWTWDTDSQGARVVRGCSYRCTPGTASAASRQVAAPGSRDEAIGFRLVRAR